MNARLAAAAAAIVAVAFGGAYALGGSGGKTKDTKAAAPVAVVPPGAVPSEVAVPSLALPAPRPADALPTLRTPAKVKLPPVVASPANPVQSSPVNPVQSAPVTPRPSNPTPSGGGGGGGGGTSSGGTSGGGEF